MRILREFKIPKIKFPKFKMEGLERIEEVKIDPKSITEEKMDKRNYEPTTYKTIKEVFERSIELYLSLIHILIYLKNCRKIRHKWQLF